jgi:hypothetical protein
MSEETTDNQNVVKPTETQTEVKQEIPYSRFKEVNDASKEKDATITGLEEQLAKFKSDQEEARQKELEKQGEYKTLLEESKTANAQLQEKANAWEEYQSARRDSLISKLPDNKRGFADGMSLTKLEEFVEVETSSGVSTNSSRAGNRQEDNGGFASKAEWAVKDPKGYAESRKKKTKWSGIF